MTVDELLEEIDDLIDKAMRIPLSGGKCMVDAEKIREIVDDIRLHLPGEFKQARAIVSDRADIISDAKREAESIVRASEEKARILISQEEVTKQAQQKARDLLSQSQQKSQAMRRGASDFAEDVLRKSEEVLSARAMEIRKVRADLRKPGVTAADESISIDL